MTTVKNHKKVGHYDIALAPLFSISQVYVKCKIFKMWDGWNCSQVCKAAVGAEQGQQGGQVHQSHQVHQVQQVQHQVQAEVKPAIA